MTVDIYRVIGGKLETVAAGQIVAAEKYSRASALARYMREDIGAIPPGSVRVIYAPQLDGRSAAYCVHRDTMQPIAVCAPSSKKNKEIVHMTQNDA